ncbi:MAG: TorF family putative porin [Isosphaeraceae bacterium]|jgi:uncharacterized protein (TIGR02001 family)
MARQSTTAGMMRSSVLGTALLAAFAFPAYAADLGSAPVEAAAPTHKLVISGNVDLTTDYVFRGFSQTDENPAIQGELDLTYNMFYLGFWGSSLNMGTAPTGNPAVFEDIANLETDWYGGIRPTWNGFTFDIGDIYYAYPNSLGSAHVPYNEVKTGVSRSFFDSKLALSLTNYWSNNNSFDTGRNDVLEFDAGWTFKKIWYFTPTVSGVVGRQWGDTSAGGISYTYWNGGLTLAFWDKPAMTVDVRYWDTNAPGCSTATIFQCDQRVVGTLKASF